MSSSIDNQSYSNYSQQLSGSQEQESDPHFPIDTISYMDRQSNYQSNQSPQIIATKNEQKILQLQEERRISAIELRKKINFTFKKHSLNNQINSSDKQLFCQNVQNIFSTSQKTKQTNELNSQDYKTQSDQLQQTIKNLLVQKRTLQNSLSTQINQKKQKLNDLNDLKQNFEHSKQYLLKIQDELYKIIVKNRELEDQKQSLNDEVRNILNGLDIKQSQDKDNIICINSITENQIRQSSTLNLIKSYSLILENKRKILSETNEQNEKAIALQNELLNAKITLQKQKQYEQSLIKQSQQLQKIYSQLSASYFIQKGQLQTQGKSELVKNMTTLENQFNIESSKNKKIFTQLLELINNKAPQFSQQAHSYFDFQQ